MGNAPLLEKLYNSLIKQVNPMDDEELIALHRECKGKHRNGCTYWEYKIAEAVEPSVNYLVMTKVRIREERKILKMLTWSFKETDELWQHGDFETEEECIQDAKENYNMKAGEQIAIGTVYPYTVCADIDSLLEGLEQDAYEECGEAAENWEITSRKHFDKEMDLLQEKVTTCVNEYLKSIGEEPTFSKIDNIYTVTLN